MKAEQCLNILTSTAHSDSPVDNLVRIALDIGEGLQKSGAEIHRVEDAIDRYTGPVLLVHGDADESVPMQCSVDAAARYQNAELAIIKGDTHCYDYHLDEAVAAVRAWMLPRR